MVKRKYVISAAFLFYSSIIFAAIPYDSIFFNKVREFIFLQIGAALQNDVYSPMRYSEKPDFCVYVSYADKLAFPDDTGYTMYCDTNETKALQVDSSYQAKGYHVFFYKTFGTYDTRISQRFLSYPDEARVFIMFREITARYLVKRGTILPYAYIDAICDVVGNYGTGLYAQSVHDKKMISAAKAQTKITEEVYGAVNSCRTKIFNDPERQSLYRKQCELKIRAVLEDANMFQIERFRHHVNNAYLLKNEKYAYYYFMLKRELIKSGSIKKFLIRVDNIYNVKQ